MKNLLTALVMILFGIIVISSCTKMDLKNQAATSLNSTNVTPDVPYCGTGYQWDFYLGKCVPVCPTGYHNDSITGACVVNAGTVVISYAGVNITYYTSSHIMSFNNSTDVNTVLNQLDADYENYNETYENQYPNATPLQLDSLDSVNNFDQLITYRNFEGQFPNYTSERSNLENIETSWINNNFTGTDPDSIDNTFDNSSNAICNNNYEVMISGTTYQWTSSGLIAVGGTQVQSQPQLSSNSSSCFTNSKTVQDFYNSNSTRRCKLKVKIFQIPFSAGMRSKVVSFRKKSNGRWKRSRLDVETTVQGSLYDNNCVLIANNVSKREPASGYRTRIELKAVYKSSWANTFTGYVSGSFVCPSQGMSGSIPI